MTNTLTTPDRQRLKLKVLRRGIRLLLGQIFIIFVSAGSFHFWQGWTYLGVNFALQFGLLFYFYSRDPQVLARRLLTREKNHEQKIIIVCLRLVIGSTLVLAGLDHRCGWTRHVFVEVPIWLTVLGLLALGGGQFLFFRVLQANRFAASIIQVESGQIITATGPYRFVRHPMYLAFAIQWLAAPLALGSIVALAASIFIVPVLILRLLEEERVLRRDLPGYADYCQQTPRRLVPFVW